MLPYFVASIAAGHCVCLWAMGDLRGEHVVADALLFAAAFLPRAWHALTRSALALWLSGMLFDTQRYFVDALRAEIHTGTFWALEQRLFPVQLGEKQTIWAEFFLHHSSAAADFLCGFCYLAYLPAFFAVWGLLLWKNRPYAELLAWAFLLTNALGVLTYLLFPLAPPWYIMEYGPGPAQLSVAGSAAGAARFDMLLGISYFEQFYSRSPNVFGAMPSLHTAYPLLATLATWHRGWVWRASCGVFTVAVGFSAVYLSHHYILDVLGGATAALLGWWAVKLAHARTQRHTALRH